MREKDRYTIRYILKQFGILYYEQKNNDDEREIVIYGVIEN